MTRGFWAGVMLSSLVIIGGAGWTLSKRLKEKKTVEVPLTKVVQNSPPAEKQPSATPVSQPTAYVPPTVAAKMPGAETSEIESESTKRKILFTLKSTKAKKVYIVGEFNHWRRQPMAKKGNVWSITLEIEPGTFEYKFVVDNKKIKDPNNTVASKAGNSVLTVKPAS